MFHVELRQFPNVTRAFNLSREELMAKIVGPWLAGVPVEWGERHWDPEKAKLAIYEGRALEPAEIGLGRGWANVTRTAAEVTAPLLEQARVPPALESFKRVLRERSATGPLRLGAVVELAGEAHPQVRLSERLALAEQAVWQLLHEGSAQLLRTGRALPRVDWEPVLLSWEAWTSGEVTLGRA
jgi:hypothetical protein